MVKLILFLIKLILSSIERWYWNLHIMVAKNEFENILVKFRWKKKFRLNRQIIFKTKFYLNQLVWWKSYVALFYKNNHWVVNYWCLRNVVMIKLNVIVPNQLWWHGTIMKQENIDWRFEKKPKTTSRIREDSSNWFVFSLNISEVY